MSKPVIILLMLATGCGQHQAEEPTETANPAIDVLLLDDHRAVDEFLLEEERVREEWDSINIELLKELSN